MWVPLCVTWMSLVAPEVEREGFYYVPSLDSSFSLEGIQDGKAKETQKIKQVIALAGCCIHWEFGLFPLS